MPSELVQQAEADAERILASVWWMGEPGSRLPVDPAHIAKEYGISTYDSELDESVSGALIKRSGEDPVILLNVRDSDNRKRFSCAHELGHYIRRVNTLQVAEEYEYVDFRGPLATAGTDSEEIYANAFAAALLMPASSVRALHRSGATPADMSYRLEVSGEAIDNRLKNLGLAR